MKVVELIEKLQGLPMEYKEAEVTIQRDPVKKIYCMTATDSDTFTMGYTQYDATERFVELVKDIED